jgi:hypothetical protein
MKYQKELTERLSAKLGIDVAPVVDELFALGMLDEMVARRGCMMQAYLLTAPDTSRSTTAILSEIAEQYHMGERTAWDIVQRVTR